MNPSKFVEEKFRLVMIEQTDGSIVSGAVENEDDERVTLKPNPLDTATVEIGLSMIKSRVESPVSPMPAGLLNGLKSQQILDLLAWFEAQGDPEHPVFK